MKEAKQTKTRTCDKCKTKFEYTAAEIKGHAQGCKG